MRLKFSAQMKVQMRPNAGPRTTILLCVPILLSIWGKKSKVRRRERDTEIEQIVQAEDSYH